MTSGLHHPFINRATDLFEWHGQLCMISDLVVGQPIDEWARSGRPSLDERCRVLVGVAQALEHAHQAHVLHRDLTPSNVFVSLLDGQPRLLDFGACMDLEAMVALTQTGMVIGKIGFLAPDLLEGARPGVRSDIYQLALLMRLVVDLETDVFPRGAERERLRLGARGETNPMSDAVPSEIRRVIQGGMSLEPSLRPGSSAALGQALLAALDADQRRCERAISPPGASRAVNPSDDSSRAKHTFVLPFSSGANTLEGHTVTRRLTEVPEGTLTSEGALPNLRPLRTVLVRLSSALIFTTFFLLGVMALLLLR